jgi:hypothetical protein
MFNTNYHSHSIKPNHEKFEATEHKSDRATTHKQGMHYKGDYGYGSKAPHQWYRLVPSYQSTSKRARTDISSKSGTDKVGPVYQ